MNPDMRSLDEQVEGLRTVQSLAPGAKIETRQGDVVALRLGEREVVFAVEGYDLWVEGRLSQHVDLSAVKAARLLRGDSYYHWGDPTPSGGFQVGDVVGLVYSDHEEYVFDNPVGVVTYIKPDPDEDGGDDMITVAVEATIGAHRVFLMGRGDSDAEGIARAYKVAEH